MSPSSLLTPASKVACHLSLSCASCGNFDDSDGDSRCRVQHVECGPSNQANAPSIVFESSSVDAIVSSDLSSMVSDDNNLVVCRRPPQLRQPSSHRRGVSRRRICGSKSTWMASTVKIATSAVIAAAATISVVFSPLPGLPLCEAFSPSSYIHTSTVSHSNVSPLHSSVHKRSGNRDVSASRVKRAPSTPLTSPPSHHDQKFEQHHLQRKQSLIEIQMKRQQQRSKRSRNVFEQFTPDYVKSSFDVEIQPRYTENNGASSKNDNDQVNGSSSSETTNSKQQKHLSQRLQSLLQNDEGEQGYFADDSPEAAQQVADIRIYGKLSEEARRKATEAVKEVKDKRKRGEGGSVGHLGVEQELFPAATVQKKRKSTIRATVKETGSDSISTYIKSLGQHELLHKADEVLLARQVRLLMNLEDSRKGLENELLRPPTFAQWATATHHTVPSLKQQIRRSQRAKAALIEANLRLVITVARQAVKKSSAAIQFQDACQQGIIGLTRATEKFDPELGFRFSTYAIWWIQKEVTKNVSEQSHTVRVPPSAIKKINDIRIQERVLMASLGRRPTDEEVAGKVGMTIEKLNFYRLSAKEVKSLDKKIDSRTGKGSAATGSDDNGQTMESFVRDTDHPSPSELIDQQMMKDDIRRLVKTLSPREQAVIRLRFGLDDGKPWTLGDIGDKFGVEKQAIKKIEARALLKLRQPSRSQVVKCYVSEHT